MHLRLLLAACVLAVPVSGALPASARTDAVQVEPKDGSRVVMMPQHASIRLGEPAKKADLVLLMPDGRVEERTATVEDDLVTSALPPAGIKGTYVLSYRVVSVDGHPVTGSVRFTVTEGATPDLTPAGTSDPPGANLPKIGVVGGAVALMCVGGMLMLAKTRKP